LLFSTNGIIMTNRRGPGEVSGRAAPRVCPNTMNELVRKHVSSFLILVLVLQVLGGISCSSATKPNPNGYDGTTDHRILILLHGSASEPTGLSNIKEPLDRWGFCVDVLDHTERYHLANKGDHWYLKDDGGGDGDLDLVVDGNMKYRVIIFDPGDGTAYGDIETRERIVKQMFQEYPFLGIARMASSYTSNGNLNNVFQVGTSGGAAKKLTITNPTGTWALEPLKGYHISRSSWGALHIAAKTSDVQVLESFDDGTPAITMAHYSSGAHAIYFAFKDWGYSPHVTMLVRLVQEYSDMPYRKPYYAMEIDDCGMPDMAYGDYIALLDWAEANLGGYPTFAFMEYLMDPSPPPGIIVHGRDPQKRTDNKYYNPNIAELMAELRSYNDYVVASHAYQHDTDWWMWSATGIPVDPYGDEDDDGIPNWLDFDIDGDGVSNKDDPTLSSYSGGAFIEPDMEVQEQWFKRMREVLDLYGYADSHVLIAPKFEYLDGDTNGLAAKYSFTTLSAKPSTRGYQMTLGWVNGTYVPGRVAPSNAGTDPDKALDSAQEALFRTQFMGYIGSSPMALITNHMQQLVRGNTPEYELRDSYLPSYLVMKKAGFSLVSTQTAANKNMGWLWTEMKSVHNSPDSISLTLDSSVFLDGKTRHELGVVLPFSIREVRAGENYWIYVDGRNLFYGKQTDSSETLRILRGTYDPYLPRITSVSTPATDVLNAVYDPTKESISLVLRGTFPTSLSIGNCNKPFYRGTTSIDPHGNAVLTISPAGEVATESVDMTVAPSSGLVNVTIQAWETSGNDHRMWTESSSVADTNTAHTVGGLLPGVPYAVWYMKDGGARIQLQTIQANSSGQISFTYDQGYSTVVFELEKVN
jgi:hypothetical protein